MENGVAAVGPVTAARAGRWLWEWCTVTLWDGPTDAAAFSAALRAADYLRADGWVVEEIWQDARRGEYRLSRRRLTGG